MRRLIVALVLSLAACAHGNSAEGEDWREQDGPPGSFDVECRFGISGCENKAADRCGPAGYHVLNTTRSGGVAGTQYWYMRAACGPA